jgi:hypothetical protein
VLSFGPEQVDRVVLRWPGRSLGLKRNLAATPIPGQPEWQPEDASDALGGVAAGQVNALLAPLSSLAAVRFTQYEGPIPAETGLGPPLVTIEVHVSDKDVMHRLRLGKLVDGNLRYATTVAGDAGPVVVLAEAPWAAWASQPPPQGTGELPEDVFEKPKAPP